MWKRWNAMALWQRILIALVLGAIVGLIWGEGAASIKWIGDIFVRLIRMIVVPLVFTTLIAGIVSMGDPSRLGSIGAKTFGMYLGTTFVALLIGLTLAAIFRPGDGIDLLGSGAQAIETREALPLVERLLSIVPTNPIAALASGDMLALIFFALLLGVGIMLVGEKAQPLYRVIDAGAEVMLKITHLVMEVAPFGVFALIAATAGSKGVQALTDAALLVVAVYLGCIIHLLIVHGTIMKVFLRLPLLNFFRGAADAQLVAFSTSSSSATLPVTLSVAEEHMGVKPVIATSVLPLGATINMDGTALYVGIVSVFSAQVFGVELAFADYLLIALTTTLVSIGTAAVPSASLFLLAAVLSTIGINAEQTALVVGFLLAFDRPLDMMRTLVNVTGDLSVATAVAKWEGELDEDLFHQKTWHDVKVTTSGAAARESAA